MKVWRIYTQDVLWDDTIALVNKYVSGATFLYGQGIWAGTREDSLVIEILGESETTILRLAHRIGAQNQQTEVYVTSQEVNFAKIKISSDGIGASVERETVHAEA